MSHEPFVHDMPLSSNMKAVLGLIDNTDQSRASVDLQGREPVKLDRCYICKDVEEMDRAMTFADIECEFRNLRHSNSSSQLKSTKKLVATAAGTDPSYNLHQRHEQHEERPVCVVKGCNKTAFTSKHISWCDEHASKLTQPLRDDFHAKVQDWPKHIQQKIESFEEIHLEISEIHGLLYGELSQRLSYEVQNSKTSFNDKKACKDLLKGIATYKKHFNPEPFSAGMLLLAVVTSLIALLEKEPGIVAFCVAVAVAVPTILIGIGVARQNALLFDLGCGGAIGLGIGMMVGGPAGGFIGMWIGVGIAGFSSKHRPE